MPLSASTTGCRVASPTEPSAASVSGCRRLGPGSDLGSVTRRSSPCGPTDCPALTRVVPNALGPV
jgi:hypothetical protein